MSHFTEGKTIGVVGLGLMGNSIITSLVLSGCRIIALAPLNSDRESAPEYLRHQLHHAQSLNLLDQPVGYYLEQITITEDYADLEPCVLVMECVVEDREIKASVHQKIEKAVSSSTIIGTNTSAIPISRLQKNLRNPERFMGIHWAEPAYATRFLEIICGSDTDISIAQSVCEWAEGWNKEPTLLQKDIRGFITNRLMYAIYREALSLEENGTISFEDLDKAARYDMGSWIPLMGIFQRMDYLGPHQEVEKYTALLPTLSIRTTTPEIMKNQVKNKHKGVHNGKGIFTYTPEEAEKWKTAFAVFNRDMYFLIEKYAELKPSKTKEIES